MSVVGQAFEDRIPYSERVLVRVEEVIRTAVCHPKGKLKISRRPQQRGEHFYCDLQLQNHDTYRRYVQADKKGADWTVAKALKKGASLASTWVGLRLRFDREGEGDYLTACSLLVLALREELYPLIRAEWDYRGIMTGRHAQPHWHVLTALQDETRRRALVTNTLLEFKPKVSSTASEEQESLHLAMGADWVGATGNQHIHKLPNLDSLVNWVRKTSEYSIDQVQYALLKAGPVDAQPAKDFSVHATV